MNNLQIEAEAFAAAHKKNLESIAIEAEAFYYKLCS